MSHQQMSMSPRDRERLDLLKRTVTKGATDDEFDLFMRYCNKFHFDPMTEVDFIIYKSKKRPGTHTASIRPNVKAMMKVAQRSPDWEGLVSCVIRKNDKIKVDLPNHKITHSFDSILIIDRGPIIGAWAKCYRKGMKPFIKTITFEEFYNPDNDLWDKFRTDMCEHTAERRVLMMAYGIEEWHSDPNKVQHKPISDGILSKEPVPLIGTSVPITGDIKVDIIATDNVPAINPDFAKTIFDEYAATTSPAVVNHEGGTQVFSFDEPEIPKTILLKNKKDNEFLAKKVDELMKNSVDQLDEDINQMNAAQDLTDPITLSAKTRGQLGDDWYCSYPFRTKESHDVPLHSLRFLIDSTLSPGEAKTIEATYQKLLKTKKRNVPLLAVYHTAMDKYIGLIIPDFILKMDAIITRLQGYITPGISEDVIFNIVQASLEWSADWANWAITYLKKRGILL